MACRRGKATAEGLQVGLRRKALVPDDPKELFDAGCELARLVTVADNDPALDAVTRPKLAAECTEAALGVLGQAIAKGFDDPVRLLMDPRLSPIAHDPRFPDLFQRWPAFDPSQIQIYRDRLTAQHEFDKKLKKSRHRCYSLVLEAGKTYQIDLLSVEFDAYLRLLDDGGGERAFDDDSGGDLNARLVFTPNQSGQHHIIVTTYRPGETGHFVLAIQEKKQ